MRIWMGLLFATFLLFQLATVFAAPSPPFFAAKLESSGTNQANPSPESPGKESDSVSETVSDSTSQRQLEGTGSQKDIEREANVERTKHDTSSAGGKGEGDDPTREANIAYFIQISEATVPHLPRLLKSIYHPKNVYAVHFDLKISKDDVQQVVQELRRQIGEAKNLHIMPSELITYRGISMLLNTINAIHLLFEKDDSWDYFINISGSDYPLVTAESQRQLLGHELGLNYFTYAPSEKWAGMAENRLSEIWFDESIAFRQNASLGKLQKLPIRNPLVDQRQFEVTHAEAWMISSREFCDFVLKSDMARKMLVAFSYAVDSSEHYFASLAWNQEKFKKTIVTHSMRLVIWFHEGNLSGQHPYYVDERRENGEYEFRSKIEKSVLFFARKFKDVDSELMDYVDERAKKKETYDAVQDHLVKKIASRFIRLEEL
ncbi:unnamed protein product [Agarophyton chilense]